MEGAGRKRWRRIKEAFGTTGGRRLSALLLGLLLAAAGGWILLARERLEPTQVRIENRRVLTAGGQRYPLADHFGGSLETWYGRVDRRNEARIHLYFRGWAADPNSGEPARRVVAFLNGRPVAVGRPGKRRPDLAQGISRDLLHSGFEMQGTVERKLAAGGGAVAAYALLESGRAALLLHGEPRQLFEKAADVRLSVQDGGRFEDVLALHQVSMEPDGRGLRIVASGGDPQIALPPVDLALKAPVVVCLELTVPAPTWVQLYYSLHASEIYTEALSQTLPLSAGRNQVHFMIWAYDLHGRLRLDPGRSPGVYRLRGLEIRRLQPPSPAPSEPRRRSSGPPSR